MNTQVAVYIVVGLALICANLPFLNNRIFAVFSFPSYLLAKLAQPNLAALSNPAQTAEQDDLIGAEHGEAALPNVALNKQFHKPFWLRLVELLLLYGLVGSLGFYLEAQQGNRFVQGWQFYATTLSLFVVFAFPGFVFRYLRRKHG